MCEIDRPAVEEWLLAKKQAGLAPWTLTGLKGVLSAIFTTAKSWRSYEGDNPCAGIRLRKGNVREKRKLTGEQLTLILATLHERERFIVQILFGLGLRISECLGLKWIDVDHEGGVLRVRRRWYRGDVSDDGENKSEAGTRDLQLGRFLTAEFLRRYPGPHKHDSFVFVGDDGALPPDDRDLLREHFRPVIKRLGLYYQGFGWHAFRRESVTMRQQAGATPIEAMKQAGHSSLDMTALYTLSDPAREREQVDAMFVWLMPTPSGPKQ
jgi:integrase